ncbi:MAG: hypothetical protein AVDCRST_MAG85-3471 [uncultured Solirubrobacteraceae bacterium]|uniref:Exo-alpha-sialidase n=1 Tax=uncultured Solirubrobacteraceae bacterium TaxID=1162706 RepID=A0A6J4TRP3_9ACTN|nr:MAG: hypothetical protein AVDCRST_MAG85-3471 [uncultured Solirubrobacteraceae bacterium]
MTRIVLLLAALLAFALPAAAQAGPQFTIGQGRGPHIVMAPDGTTARAVWNDDVAKQIHFCSIPRGATACTNERTFAMPPGASSPGPPYVVNAGGDKIHIAQQDFAGGNAFLYTSLDGGLNWGAPEKVYDPNNDIGLGQQEPIFDSSGAELIFPSGGKYIYSAKTDATEKDKTDVAVLNTSGVEDLRDLHVARDAGSALVALAHNGKQIVFYRSAGGDPSVEPSWEAAKSLGQGDDARLASAGGATPWMMATVGDVGAKRVEVRQWTGTTFGAPKVLAQEQGVINDITISGAAIGAIWRDDGSATDRMRFGVSTDNGSTFGVSTIVLEDSVMASMDLALGGDGKGFAIFEGSGDTGTGAKSMIKVASTDTVAEPTPPGTGGGGTTAPPTTPVVTPKPGTTSTTPLAVGRTVSARVPGATLSLGLPRGCIPAGRPFVARLTFKKQRRKGSVFVKVTRTDFYVGTKRLKIDRRSPFTQILRIPNPRAGRSYSFRARAFIKVRRGKAPKKSIRATLKVCG